MCAGRVLWPTDNFDEFKCQELPFNKENTVPLHMNKGSNQSLSESLQMPLPSGTFLHMIYRNMVADSPVNNPVTISPHELHGFIAQRKPFYVFV